MLNVLDDFTRDCPSIKINRKLTYSDVIDVLSDLFILRGVPEHIRSDNGPEFVAKAASRIGLPPSASGPHISNRGACGRMAT